jgi:hypothetical protein
MMSPVNSALSRAYTATMSSVPGFSSGTMICLSGEIWLLGVSRAAVNCCDFAGAVVGVVLAGAEVAVDAPEVGVGAACVASPATCTCGAPRAPLVVAVAGTVVVAPGAVVVALGAVVVVPPGAVVVVLGEALEARVPVPGS